MIKTWVIRLELARDDNGLLSDDGIETLTRLLAEGNGRPVLTRGDSGSVYVQMTLEARDDMAARSAAERMLRDGANAVWLAQGLPPFTITFVDATQVPR
jgi:NADPH-dependent 2,4-dienoyl-CoA reductase/sulfur reductase-like enzyme